MRALVDASAKLIHAILEHYPEVTVVATSREVLGLPGETVWSVPPLALPPANAISLAVIAESDAVALFCERARSVRRGFALNESNSAAVVRICHRLDGVPLALELAAGRLGMLSAHQVAERLDHRFRLLTGGARTAVPRHQNSEGGDGLELPGPPALDKLVLRHLAVFPPASISRPPSRLPPSTSMRRQARLPDSRSLICSPVWWTSRW